MQKYIKSRAKTSSLLFTHLCFSSVVICIMEYTDKNIGLQKKMKLNLKIGLQKGFGRLLSVKHLEDGT